ncbi:N-acyl homoserine lactonase family protein [Streptomyces vilmorinianum]|uniref:N-acyl homoserine lactonase family protein n=1 Tax=Streptomyces vilmorinianum TaxID=3051092 RepID=UPI0010FBA52F|nr:N-acyl homoserine lactonase family protein [Streptomyces vilmorinianum]
MTSTTVQLLDLGYFVRPAEEWGGPHARVEPVLAYLVRHEGGTLVFDTGIGTGSPETDAHYQPRRRALTVSPEDVDLVVNCHLHFDHIGGNQLFPDTPVLVQRKELATARAGDYTLDRLLDGVRYQEIDGEYEIAPGITVVPTPGHTEGHQSLVIDHGDHVTVLAGQAYDFAAEFGVPYRPWLDRLAELARGRTAYVRFAHDRDLWEGVLPPRR